MEIFEGVFINFPLILLCLVLITGFVYLLDKFYLHKKRYKEGYNALIKSQNNSSEEQIRIDAELFATKSASRWISEPRSIFPIILIIFILRSFIVEPFRIPSGSMEPTLMPGDFIVVNKFAYGIKFPVTETLLFTVSKPQRGEIAIFKNPLDKRIYFIKRVIGIPGDKIAFKNNKFYVNDQEIPSEHNTLTLNDDSVLVNKKIEDFFNVKHYIYKSGNESKNKTYDDYEITVPQDSYFMMGDHRSNSSDSRKWGVVPFDNFIGKFMAVWLSFDSNTLDFRWERFGEESKPK